jgi:molybdopterin-containing oxidoreductase family membrane subunit
MSSNHTHEHPSLNFKAPDLTIPEICEAAMDPVGKSGWRSNLVLCLCALVVAFGMYRFWTQMHYGMGVTNLMNPVFWGAYIITFVFWIGVAHAGALISALLRLCGAEWKGAVTRVAEVITLFTLPAAASYPLIHLGRTELFYYIIPYPNFRFIWPNFKSMLAWDFFAISTYLTGSVLFLYVTMVPDLGIARPRMTGWKKTLYTFLSWGWRGTAEEWRRVKEAAALYSVVILPVVISVHTIVSYDFAMQRMPAWHSDVFGPLFFVGALFSGVASVVTVLVILYWTYPPYRHLISEVHYDMLGRVWLVLGLAWAYLFWNDFIPSYYAYKADKMDYLYYIGMGPYAPYFWAMFVCNFVAPLFTLSFQGLRRNWIVMFVLSILVNVGMYLERVVLFIPGPTIYNSLVRNTFEYSYSITEFAVVAATFAGVIGGYTLFCRVFPILPMWELAETKAREVKVKLAGKEIAYFLEGE